MENAPRTTRELLASLLGKKVTVGTDDNHYICGIVRLVDGSSVQISVGDQTINVPTRQVAVVHEAPILQAEFIK
ncbi:MAG: hypothetical protein V2A73_06210 [Pseudomonadota bacterium]